MSETLTVCLWWQAWPQRPWEGFHTGCSGGVVRVGALQEDPTQKQGGHLFLGTTKPDEAKYMTMKIVEPFHSLLKKQGVSRQGRKRIYRAVFVCYHTARISSSKFLGRE